jgi:hypothetical protein
MSELFLFDKDSHEESLFNARISFIEGIKHFRNPPEKSTLPLYLLNSNVKMFNSSDLDIKSYVSAVISGTKETDISFHLSYITQQKHFTSKKSMPELEILHDLEHLFFGEIFGEHNDRNGLVIFPNFDLTVKQLIGPFETPKESIKLNGAWDTHILKCCTESEFIEAVINIHEYPNKSLKSRKLIDKIALESVRWNLFYLLYREIVLDLYAEEYLDAIESEKKIPFLSIECIEKIERVKKMSYIPNPTLTFTLSRN